LIGSATSRIPLLAFVIGGLAPDVDYLFVWAESFNAWHRVVTHNLPFVTLVTGLGVPFARHRRLPVWPVMIGLFAGGMGHLLVDACMDTNASNGLGVAILWPASDVVWSPINLVELEDNPSGWGDPVRASRGVLRGAVLELPAIVLAALVLFVRAHRSGLRRPREGVQDLE
jgi:hypothetical protein